ncbi:MAG: adenine phosphoribosyltransferase [Actinobacteria bacterium]|nr:adenine phosphoribosyltransferase [Actinomycetota bacterium]MBW3643040.1 adenine phosphoribosyltransferase [Actinomycetota bacterium]
MGHLAPWRRRRQTVVGPGARAGALGEYREVVEQRTVPWRGLVRDIPDFPAPGVLFKDITPVLADPGAFSAAVDELVAWSLGRGVDFVVGIEARGFILAAPIAYRLGAGFVPVRKAGKLPWAVEQEGYSLEYGADRLEIHADGLPPASRVLVVDDVLATGGTASATVRLVERLGAEVVGLGFVIELGFLAGRTRLAGRDVHSLIAYPATPEVDRT